MIALKSTIYPLTSAFASWTLAAPLNERDQVFPKRESGSGWQCRYDGLLDTNIDATIDLPGMVAGLCLKVNFSHEGCDNFRPTDSFEKKSCPDSEWDSALSICLGTPHPEEPTHDPLSAQSVDRPGEDDTKKKEHKSPKDHKKENKENGDSDKKPTHAQSFEEPSPGKQRNNDYHKKENKKNGNHNKKPSHAQSFEEPNPGKQRHNDKHDKLHKSDGGKNDQDGEKKTHSQSVAEDIGNHCSSHEHYSSAVNKCVDKGSFSQPTEDSSCPTGILDAVLELCLDVSLLGPVDTQISSVTSLNSEDTQLGQEKSKEKCSTQGQKYSSLVSACVDADLLSEPLVGNTCGDGKELDLLSGLCLDLSVDVLGLKAKATITK